MDAITAVFSSTQTGSLQATGAAPSQGFVALSQAAHAPGAAAQPMSAYANLTGPLKASKPHTQAVGPDLSAMGSTFRTGLTQGFVKPQMLQMEAAIGKYRSGDQSATADILMASVRLNQAASLSNTLTSMSSSVRKGVGTLVERVG